MSSSIKPGTAPHKAVTLNTSCPWCGDVIHLDHLLSRNGRRRVIAFITADGGHTCPPPQPDEPTEFGAKVSVTLGGGETERFISCGDGWILTNPSTAKFQSQPWHWDYLIDRGTVSLGWGDES